MKYLVSLLALTAGAAFIYLLGGKKIKNYLANLQDVSANKKLAVLATDRPMISFSFDDIPQSACDAAAMLKEQNAVGTFYICMDFADSSSGNQIFFSRESLKKLVNDGHEIGSHTFAHINCKTTADSAIESDLVQNEQAFKELYGQSLENFAFPFGAFSAASKKIAGKMFTSSRSIIPGINSGTIDLNLLKANKLYENIPVENAIQLIEENNKKKGWLIFYTHDVQENPSIYGCSPEYFQKVLKAAVESGAEILPVKDALKKMKPV